MQDDVKQEGKMLRKNIKWFLIHTLNLSLAHTYGIHVYYKSVCFLKKSLILQSSPKKYIVLRHSMKVLYFLINWTCFSDLFFTRVTPSKMFDVLKDDFDHYFIALVLGGMIAVSVISRKLAARKALNRAWKWSNEIFLGILSTFASDLWKN